MKLPNIKDSEIFKTPRVRKDYLQRKNCTLVNSGKKKKSQKNIDSNVYIEYFTLLNYYLIPGIKLSH